MRLVLIGSPGIFNQLRPVIKTSNDTDIFQEYRFSEPSADIKMMQGERNDTIKKIIDKLPQDQREIIILRHYANLTFKEIASLTNISINTALGRMRYGLMNIRKMMPENQLAI